MCPCFKLRGIHARQIQQALHGCGNQHVARFRRHYGSSRRGVIAQKPGVPGAVTAVTTLAIVERLALRRCNWTARQAGGCC